MRSVIEALLLLSLLVLSSAAKSAAEGPYPRRSSDELKEQIGQTVRLRAEIKRFVGPKSATLDLDGWWGWDEMLMISPEQGLAAFKEGQEIWLEGEVRSLVTNELNRSFGVVHSGDTPINRKQEVYISVQKITAAAP